MMKRLIVFLDGTWNQPDDKKNATTVDKLMRAICPFDQDGVAQVTFYDKGVGTGGPIDRLSGGAFGRGLDDNVKDGYRFLANNYVPGDEIYIFGFSRGAFTARSLAGFMGVCGLLDKRTMGRLNEAWELYRTPPEERSEEDKAGIRAISRYPVPIRCVGVWDTVGALGVPLGVMSAWNRRKFKFHDTTIGSNIDRAFHALAIDEQRGPFQPTLWQTPVPRNDQIVEQVWFAGVHSNIGGSYDDPGLSDIALAWMIDRVDAETALAFDPDYRANNIKGDAAGTLYDSRSAMYAFSKIAPYARLIGQADTGGGLANWLKRKLRPDTDRTFVNEMIHRSALDRLSSGGLIDGEGHSSYAPDNLTAAQGKLPVVD